MIFVCAVRSVDVASNTSRSASTVPQARCQDRYSNNSLYCAQQSAEDLTQSPVTVVPGSSTVQRLPTRHTRTLTVQSGLLSSARMELVMFLFFCLSFTASSVQSLRSPNLCLYVLWHSHCHCHCVLGLSRHRCRPDSIPVTVASSKPVTPSALRPEGASQLRLGCYGD